MSRFCPKHILSMGMASPLMGQKSILGSQKKHPLFTYKAQVHILHKQIYSLPLALKFHRGVVIRENNYLKRILGSVIF